MNPVQIVAGVVAGAVGAAIWAAIAYYANVEVGYVAWGIGGLVGYAVASTGSNGKVAGAGAVLITAIALLAGKYATVEIWVQEEYREIVAAAANPMSEEVATTLLARDSATAREAAGESLEWPNTSEENRPAREYFPSEIWLDAEREWNAMDDAQKLAFKEERQAAYLEAINADMDANRKAAFLATFSPFDLLFFGLAVVTAWGLANGYESSGSSESTDSSTPPETV